jgi:hypothetical protein
MNNIVDPVGEAAIDELDITVDDLAKIVGLRHNTSGELVPVVRLNPITGRWELVWVEPPPQPDWFQLNVLDVLTNPVEAAREELVLPLVDEITADQARSVELLDVAAGLQRIADHYADNVGAAYAEPFRAASRRLFVTGLNRLRMSY